MKNTFKIVLYSLLIYLPISSLISSIGNVVESHRETVDIWLQQFPYGYIRDLVKSGQPIPLNIGEFPILQQKSIQAYYPDAWQTSNILFLHKRGQFYSITFGDGRQARLTHWQEPYWRIEDGKLEDEKIAVSKLGFGTRRSIDWLSVLGFGILAVLITTIVCSKISKSTMAQGK